jgi:transcriptional regulator with XRE-family HTH domain
MTPIQCKMARMACGWSMEEFGRRSGTSKATIKRYENIIGWTEKSYSAPELRRVFEQSGVEFVGTRGVLFPEHWNKWLEEDARAVA